VANRREDQGKLPDTMQVTLTKSGDQVQITVSMDGQSWTVKDTEVDKLPGEVRGALLKFVASRLMPKFGPHAGFLSHFGSPFGAGPPPWVMHGHEAARHHGAHAHQRDGHHRGPRHGMGRHHRGGPRHGMAVQHHGGFRHGPDGHGDCPLCAARLRMAQFHAGFHHGAGHGHGEGCPICSAGQGQHPNPQEMLGPHHPAHGAARMMGARPEVGQRFEMQVKHPEVGRRLEMLVQHLEQIHAHRAGGQPGGEPRVLAEPSNVDQLKMQLHRLQEQQERMMRSLHELGEALEKSQPQR
jgi:hypothetical protein